MESDDRKAILGKRIKALRKAQGLSVRRFALMVGTGRSYVSEIEDGRVNVGLDLLCRIAKALGVTVGDLVDDRSDDARS